MKTYKCLHPVDCGGRYEVDELIELSDDDAANLLALNVIVEADEAAGPAKAKKKK